MGGSSSQRSLFEGALVKAGGPRAYASLVRTALPCFGVWTLHTWIMWLNTNVPVNVPGAPWVTVYLAQSLLLVAVVVLFRAKPKPSAAKANRADVAFTMIGCATTGLYAADSLVGPLPGWLAVAAVSLGGVCLGWGYLRWGVFYSGLDLRNALGCIFAACILGAVAKSFISEAGWLIGFVFALALPALSGAFLTRAFKLQRPQATGEIRYTRETAWSLWKIMSCVAIFAFVYAFSTRLPKMFDNPLPYAQLLGHAIEIAVSAFILWWVIGKRRSLGFAQLWRCVMVLIGVMLVLGVFEPTAQLQTACSTSISYLVVVFLWLLLSDIAHHSDLHPYVVFGAGWLAYTFPNYLGKALGGSGLIAPAMTPSIALVLLLVIMLAITLLLETRDPAMQRIFSDLESRPAPQDFSFIDERCAALGGQYALTAREVEVMQLLCKGRSKAYIAETLFITENTVRGHARRLYAKLDVHSKKELQELIGI
ncbi:helix-turn-helix transcriptional regulator [Arabiibacter massiliensis]|uniref:helix-turn-helix transcriptional regulator n=1 Tax=Arabiibacter massiliensis TaxID=1870985 RepID=UPI00155AE758|nr:helix-turn-helix transcriptional regulator [Arabiibacter massiliensis]